MSSAFSLPFKVDNQTIWQKPHSEVLHHALSLCGGYRPPFLFKTGLQVRAIVPSTMPEQLYKGAPFPATVFTYFCKYGNCKKNSATLVCDGDIDK